MNTLRHTLLAAMLAVAVGATAARAAEPQALVAPPSGVLGITDAQLDPAFWVSRAGAADSVVFDTRAIAAINDKVMRLDPSMHDIRHLGATLPRDRVKGWVAKLTSKPSKTLYDVEGKEVPAATIDAVMANARIEGIPASVTPRYGMAVRRSALRGFPTDLRVFSHADDTDIDRFQESTLFPGDPLVVVHTSQDGKWAFVVSPRYAAWMHADDIALGDAQAIFA
ncbi:SH3 domain-containing protein, partial [Luteibacter sp.]|uniref:SH3 domain-containing protein n=1 Tax=Luteibacter sp. TaxID=1886636 RepID=UPI003F7D3119